MQHSFKKDIEEGLSSIPKQLSSRYFYDDDGSKLFRVIMQLPEYYLTDCEYEIFSTQADAIVKAMSGDNKVLRLIDFGAGDGVKTKLLITAFLKSGVEVVYTPVDISEEAIRTATENMRVDFPDLKIEPVQGEYFAAIEKINATYTQLPKVILFLGSNIGNFTHEESVHFLTHLQDLCNENDKLFLGFDLKKNPATILNAYNDSKGITKMFNLNLLKRINRELGGNFELDKFDHYATYDPISGTAKSFIVSLAAQEVYIKSLSKKFSFNRFEPVFVEQSQKFDIHNIELLAKISGFNLLADFFDCKHFYTNSLWEKE